MFQFANPDYLYFLLIIPVLVGLFLYSQWQVHRRESRWGNRAILKPLVQLRSTLRPIFKFSLLCLSIILGVIVLARPQFGIAGEGDQRKGIEAIIAIDVSQSMLAQDVMPSRIERSKLLVSSLVDHMENDKIGLEVFAGEAYPQLPITNDYISAQLFLDNITTEAVSLQGTNIAAAISLADKSFTQEKNVGKAIIIITDGEDHEVGAIEAAEAAAKNGRRVYVLGVGSTSGAEIPTSDGPLTDNSGSIVRTALNEEMCKSVAKAGKGIYIHIDGTSIAQDRLEAELRKLQQSDSGFTNNGTPNEQFHIFALLMLIVLIIELLVLERQNPFFQRFRLFQK